MSNQLTMGERPNKKILSHLIWLKKKIFQGFYMNKIYFDFKLIDQRLKSFINN